MRMMESCNHYVFRGRILMTMATSSSLRSCWEPWPSVAQGSSFCSGLIQIPLLPSPAALLLSLTLVLDLQCLLGICHFLVSGSLLLFADYSQSLKMWLLKFHFKYSLYQLIFIEVLLPSTIGCKKASCLYDPNNNNIVTTYLVFTV